MEWHIKKYFVKARIESPGVSPSNSRFLTRDDFKSARLTHMQVFDDDRPGVVGFTFPDGKVAWVPMADVGQGNASAGINPNI